MSNSNKEKRSATLTHSQLCQIATKKRDQQSYILWLCLQSKLSLHINSFLLADINKIAEEYLSMSDWQTWQLLRSGEYKYWDIIPVKRGINKYELQVFLYNEGQIIRKYGEVSDGTVSEFNVEQFKGKSLGERNALIFKYGLVQEKKKKKRVPVSRDTISKRFGISKTTQIRYEKQAKIRVKENFALVIECNKHLLNDADTVTTALEHINKSETNKSKVNFELFDNTERSKGKYSHRSIGGIEGIFRQLPNSYHANIRWAPRNVFRRYIRKLKVDTSAQQAIENLAHQGSPKRLHEYRRVKKTSSQPTDHNCFSTSSNLPYWHIWRSGVRLT